jgi:hypothetical protein
VLKVISPLDPIRLPSTNFQVRLTLIETEMAECPPVPVARVGHSVLFTKPLTVIDR